MGGFNNPILSGDGTLIRSNEKSPNFVHGSAGWAINKDGSAEFNTVTIRGATTSQSVTLIYNGTPAAGNLIVSISATRGTDTFGNVYVSGIGLYNSGQVVFADAIGSTLLVSQVSGETASRFLLLSPGDLIWGDGTNPQDTKIARTAAGVLTVTSSMAVVTQVTVGSTTSTALVATGTPLATTTSYTAMVTGEASSRWVMDASGKQGWGPGNVTRDTFLYRAGVGALAVDSALVGGVAGVANTWQTPVLGTGWATGPTSGSVKLIQYRIDAEDNLVIVGSLHSTTTTPAATLFTLTGAYVPLKTHRVAVTEWFGSAATLRYVEINLSGAVTLSANPAAASHDYYIYATVPLGNIA